MSNEVEGLERGVVTARKAASNSIAFLKSAASAVKAKPDVVDHTAVVVVRGQGPTVISLGVEIVGAVNSPEDLHIYGTIEGNVRATSVTVCDGGSVVGDIVAETVNVNGKVKGRIYGRGVQLQANAVVSGDVFHNSLGIDPLAVFEGSSRRVADPLADTPAAPVAANAA